MWIKQNNFLYVDTRCTYKILLFYITCLYQREYKHQRLWQSTCLFWRSTVEAFRKLEMWQSARLECYFLCRIKVKQNPIFIKSTLCRINYTRNSNVCFQFRVLVFTYVCKVCHFSACANTGLSHRMHTEQHNTLLSGALYIFRIMVSSYDRYVFLYRILLSNLSAQGSSY